MENPTDAEVIAAKTAYKLTLYFNEIDGTGPDPMYVALKAAAKMRELTKEDK